MCQSPWVLAPCLSAQLHGSQTINTVSRCTLTRLQVVASRLLTSSVTSLPFVGLPHVTIAVACGDPARALIPGEDFDLSVVEVTSVVGPDEGVDCGSPRAVCD